MIQATVDRKAFLDVCGSLNEETVDVIVMTYPDVFRSAVVFGDAPAAPAKAAAKPRERKAPRADSMDIVTVRDAMRGGADTTQAIVSRAGLTNRSALAAIKALIEAGEAEQVSKGRGAKYVLKAAA